MYLLLICYSYLAFDTENNTFVQANMVRTTSLNIDLHLDEADLSH